MFSIMTSAYYCVNANLRVLYDKLYHYWTLDKETAHDNANVDRCNGNSTMYGEISTFLTNPTKVDDNLYLGNSYNAANYHQLKDLDIEIIINVTQEITNYYEYCEEFEYLKIDVLDNNNNSLKNHYEQIYDYIMEHQDTNILIHCFAGKSRSASAVLYYFIKKYDLTIDEALERLTELRDFININTTFMDEIRELITPSS